MRLPDLWIGLVIAVLGGLIAARAQTFPQPAGAASPRLFPEVIGTLLAIGGLIVALRGWRARRAGMAGANAGEGVVTDWMRDPRRLGAVLFVPGAIVAYALIAPAIGSLPVAVAIVGLYALISGGRWLPAFAVALVVSVVVIAFFVQIMGVPLPLGPLGGWL